MTPLAREVAAALRTLVPPDAVCLVAVSGGTDSLALLDLLHLTRELHRCRLVVGHVDHGISDESALVAARVAAAAEARGLPVHLVRLDLGSGAGETRARTARRAALRRMMEEACADWIVLGHHADDQVETVLLRLLRGSGPAGLAGMARRSGRWVRPLLTVSRQRLADHLHAQGMTPWEDPANVDPRHLRSWTRQLLLPTLTERLPDVRSRLLRATRQAASARMAWDAIPGMLPELDLRRDVGVISVAAPPLWGYRSEVRHALLAALGRGLGVPLGDRRLAALDRLAGAVQGRVRLSTTLEAELFDGRLALRGVSGDGQEPVPLVPGRSVRVGSAQLHASVSFAGETQRVGWSTALSSGAYFARAWQRGDRIRPLGGDGSRAVAVLLREARVPVGERLSWPVVTDADSATIVWVPGICRAGASLPEPGTKALHVECAFS